MFVKNVYKSFVKSPCGITALLLIHGSLWSAQNEEAQSASPLTRGQLTHAHFDKTWFGEHNNVRILCYEGDGQGFSVAYHVPERSPLSRSLQRMVFTNNEFFQQQPEITKFCYQIVSLGEKDSEQTNPPWEHLTPSIFSMFSELYSIAWIALDRTVFLNMLSHELHGKLFLMVKGRGILFGRRASACVLF